MDISNIDPAHFIEEIVKEDLLNHKHPSIYTRFPPEPNGYLHIGHAKSICLNFGLADKFGGKTNLRLDDTNPTTESTEYVESIKKDVKWLGFDWDGEFFASDYFDRLYLFAEELILKGLAYVDDSTAEQIAELKGTPTSAGKDSPYRSRSIEENIDLFRRMRAGEFPDGAKVLRAKIDMASPNLLLRDPIMYRIKHEHHHRTGDKWCIYPMYDFAHGLSDSIEGITHSICTLEFESHRPLYNWFLENVDTFKSRQIEFARLNLSYTIVSKRKLLQLVNEKHVSGWDDPRMPTISAVRRRGYPAAAIREFAHRVGVARRENLIDIGLLEFCVREELNKSADRYMAVLKPLKVVITNLSENHEEKLTTDNNPEDASRGTRELIFSREIYIEADDFMENPPKKYFRLFPGGMVRLKSAYIIVCDEVIKDKEGNILELHCRYIPESKSGEDTSGIHVKGTLHWVSAKHALTAEARMYDRLFTVELPDADETKDFKEFINPNSLTVLNPIFIEPAAAHLNVGDSIQFLRHGYFCVDPDSTTDKKVFNLTVGLKDTWSKNQK